MRMVAAFCCVFAAGCSTSLGIAVPGAARYESRPSRPPAAAAPEPSLTLTVPRDALALTATVQTWSAAARTGEFRRVQERLTFAIPYSFLIEHGELVAGVLLVPPLIPVLLYQLVWWIWSRGLTDQQRAELDAPWGSGLRDATGQALWPGCNVTDWWSWRAGLIPLDTASIGGWRRRTVVDRTPMAEEVTLEIQVGTGSPTVLRAVPVAGRADWSLTSLGLNLTGDAPVTITARSSAGTATTELPAAFVKQALAAEQLRTTAHADPADATAHVALAELHASAGGYVQARGEWALAARADDGRRRTAAAAIDRLWVAEADAARARGDVRHALFCVAVRPLEQQLLRGEVSAQPLEAEPKTLAGRITQGVLRERVRSAMAWTLAEGAPGDEVARALLSTAGDHESPVAAWAALRACAAHPQRLAADILPALLTRDAPAELHRLAAEAIIVGDPDRALRTLAPFADRPAVHWVLSGATGATLGPVAADWNAWVRAESDSRRWDGASRRYRVSRDR